MLNEENVEAQSEGHDEDGKNEAELHHRLQDVEEHDHIDAKERQLP